MLHTDRATRKRDYARASRLLVDDVPEMFVTWPKDIESTRTGVVIDDGSHNVALPYLFHVAR